MPRVGRRSMSSSGATVTAAMLVCSGRFIGTATARTRMLSIFSFIFPRSAACAFP